MSASPPSEFVDSNVLVYAHDVSAADKHETARELIARLWRERSGCLSIQTLQEFAVNVTRKVPQPLSVEQTQHIITALSEWTVHSPTSADVVAALDRQRRHRISFWDAMILQSASRLGCTVVWSEDLSDCQIYDGLTVRDPFVTTDES